MIMSFVTGYSHAELLLYSYTLECKFDDYYKLIVNFIGETFLLLIDLVYSQAVLFIIVTHTCTCIHTCTQLHVYVSMEL